MDDTPHPVRLDRWLWAARLVRTRTLAAEAVKGGRVHVNGRATKPGRDVRVGDRVEITAATTPITVIVLETAVRRGPASVAAALYEETADSRLAREREAARRRVAGVTRPDLGGRPTGRDRRRLDRARDARRGS